jgi:hypothetical protein
MPSSTISVAMRTAAAAVRLPARLEQVQLASLDGELDVLHLVIVPLELVLRVEQFAIRLRQSLRHLVDVERCADARDHVFTLGVDEEFTVELALASARIAREGDAGAGIITEVAEHHADDVDRGAEVVGDIRVTTVVDRFLERP